MKNIVEIIKALPNLLPLKPATETQITDAELQLRVGFAEEYKEYLASFGAILADGIELTGIAKAEHRNVVFVTKKEREINPKIPNTLYVIEDTHVDGIIIWQDTTGKIYKSLPNTEPQIIAASLEEYISKRSSIVDA